MTTITITLDDDQLARFREPAELLGITPAELAERSIGRFLAGPDEDFGAIIDEVLADHGELLRRLAL